MTNVSFRAEFTRGINRTNTGIREELHPGISVMKRSGILYKSKGRVITYEDREIKKLVGLKLTFER
jgi:hypothetical protein